MVALAITVVGILLIPFAAVAYALAVLGALDLGFLAMSLLAGDALMRDDGYRARPRDRSSAHLIAGLTVFLVLWLLAGGAAFSDSRAACCDCSRSSARGSPPPSASARRSSRAQARAAVDQPTTRPAPPTVPRSTRGRRLRRYRASRRHVDRRQRRGRANHEVTPARARLSLRARRSGRGRAQLALAHREPSARHRRHVCTCVLRYDAGTVTVGAAAAPLLYQANARFDANEQRLSRSYNPVSNTLRIGLDSSDHATHPRATRTARATTRRDSIWGSPRAFPLDLDLDLGTTRATRRSERALGGARARLRPARRKPISPSAARIRSQCAISSSTLASEASRFTSSGTRARSAPRIASTVGSVDLDLGGDWTGDMPLTMRVALASATLRVPRDVGVAMRLSTRIANIDSDGFTERDGVMYSTGYEQAKRHVTDRWKRDARLRRHGLEGLSAANFLLPARVSRTSRGCDALDPRKRELEHRGSPRR